jgi:regulatory protein
MSDGADRAYVAGLALLARRELSQAQLQQRLTRRKFDAADIDAAIARLRDERALDDRRTAVACARTELRVKHHGRARVVRRVEALGISRELAQEAVAEVFDDQDEDELLRDAVERRLRHGIDLRDPAVFRRMHRYCVNRGFEPDRVTTILRNRAKKNESL